MEENKNFDVETEETCEDVAEEVVEETVEDTAEEVVEETMEDVAEEAFEEAEIAENAVEIENTAVAFEGGEKKKNGKEIAVIITAVVAVIAILTGVIIGFIGWDTFKKFDDTTWLAIKRIVVKNPYNEMGYMNFSGKTVGDLAEAEGVELKVFLEEKGLPEDMPADTFLDAAQYCLPLSKMLEGSGMDMEFVRTMYGVGEEITEDSTYGELMDATKLKILVDEDKFEDFKEHYGFGEEVTLETTFGEVRRTIHKKDYEESLKEQEEAEQETEQVQEDVSSEESEGTETAE